MEYMQQRNYELLVSVLNKTDWMKFVQIGIVSRLKFNAEMRA